MVEPLRQLKWIVLEENPKPDDYIAVMAADEARVLKVEKLEHSVYSSSMEAIVRARFLRDIFRVKAIRIFYLEGYSETVDPNSE